MIGRDVVMTTLHHKTGSPQFIYKNNTSSRFKKNQTNKSVEQAIHVINGEAAHTTKSSAPSEMLLIH